MTTSIQNISTNSWKTLPKDERKKIIVGIQQQNNQLSLQIDEHQKELCIARATIPEECRRVFEEEVKARAQRALTAPLHPEIEREGMSTEETQRMKKMIRDRVERHLEEHRSAEDIENEIRKKSENAKILRQNILEMTTKMMKSINN